MLSGFDVKTKRGIAAFLRYYVLSRVNNFLRDLLPPGNGVERLVLGEAAEDSHLRA
jgi:hypothetical protein